MRGGIRKEEVHGLNCFALSPVFLWQTAARVLQLLGLAHPTVNSALLAARVDSYRNGDLEMPTSPHARVTPIARSVISSSIASRLACGLTTFG
jgi:hypothetical protein